MMALQILFEWLASLVEVLLFFYVIDAISDRRFTKGKQGRFTFIVAGFVAFGVILMNLAKLSISLPTFIYAVIVYALGAKLLFRGRFPDYLLASVGYIAFLSFVDMMLFLAMNHVGIVKTTEAVQQITSFDGKRVALIALAKAVDVTLVLFFGGLLRKKVLHTGNRSFAITIICLILGSAGSIYYVIHLEYLLGFSWNFSQILLGLSCILIVAILYLTLRIWEIRQEAEYADRRNQLLETNYRLAKETYESNAKLYHDMRNHFLAVQNYLAGDHVSEAQEYLEKLVGNYKAFGVERQTGIEAVDYILCRKTEIARERGIVVQIHSEYPKDCQIDPVDLCTIFSNLFDNAIEACEKCQQDAKKEIILTIRRIHQFILIRMQNSSVLAPVIKDGTIDTSKADRSKHGWGLLNIESAVEKYGGTIEYDYNGSLFSVSIMFFY